MKAGRLAAALVAAAVSGLGAARFAGQAGRSQTPTFTAAVDLVKVDVSVLDKQGQPVHGLAAGDFTVLEDGKPQRIQAFASIDLPDPDPAAAAWTRDVAPDVTTNADAEDLRLIVIVMDDALVPADPAMVANSKRIAKSAIDKLGARDLAAVVFTHDAVHGQEFTRDRARLLAAVDAFSSGGYSPSTNPRADAMDSSLIESSVDALDRLAQVLGGVTDRRKAVIWIGIGLPLSPWEMAGGASWQKEVYLRWVAALDAVRRANVNVFAVDPAGLDGLRFYMANHAGPLGASPSSDDALHDDPAAGRASQFQRYLQGLADDTGGRAFLNSNEFDSKIAQILRETGSFYLLGYAPPAPSGAVRYRKIQVKVNRPGVTTHARNGYYTASPEAARAAAAAPVSPVVAGLAGLLPRRDVPIRVSAAPFAGDDRATGAIVVAATVTPPAAPPPGGIDVLVEAFGADGKAAASERTRATPSRSGATACDTSVRLDVPIGRYQLRVAAGNEAMGVGSVYTDVDVLDVGKAPLTWSGAVVGHAGDRRSTLGPIVPITPLTSRVFATTDDASVFARLYEGGVEPPTAVTVRTRILDETGATRLNLSETIPPERFGANRAIDVIRVLPLSQLAKGSCLLSLEATVGKSTVQRDVRFDVR